MNTNVSNVVVECESIISCVENVINLCDGNDFVTNLLQVEEFETIRSTAEKMQTLVLDGRDVYEESITLYQEVKYTLEALEESIQDLDVLNQFNYIRASVNVIRNDLQSA